MVRSVRTSLGLAIILILFFFQMGVSNAAPLMQDNRTDSFSIKIMPNYYYISIPNTMEIGKHYVVLVPVENTGNDETNCSVLLSFNWKYFYCNEPFMSVPLKGGEKQLLKFSLVAHKSHIGILNIKANLYEDGKELDSISDAVLIIKKSYLSGSVIFFLFGLLLAGVAYRVLRSRNTRNNKND